jgi:adenine/guanine phosphoribosyltransferase-like PRPP-binding protein
MMERVLNIPWVRTIQIDFTNQNYRLLQPSEWMEYKKRGRTSTFHSREEFDYTTRLLSLAGFLESIGTTAVLNRPDRGNRFFLTGLRPEMLSFRSWYADTDFSTVVFGLTRIESKEDCGQFLDELRILRWRELMGARFHRSPLFRYDEVWRVLCHELAVNAWEHSGTAGVLAARVVQATEHGKVRPFCRLSYADPALGQLSRMAHFLELCIADYGNGIVTTLKEAYQQRAGTVGNPVPDDVLAFAFDEFGTCKSSSESWATERHALGRILLIVAKYGGFLALHSGGAKITYMARGGQFQRLPNHLGYVPHSRSLLNQHLKGTQLQILLPLEPSLAFPEKNRESVLVSAMPDSYRIDPTQIRGHLVPLLETLEFPGSCAGKQEQKSFRAACEKLCRKLAACRPAGDPLILDFHDLVWTSPQFETFLFLFQNLLQTRPVLLVQLPPSLAREASDLEDQNAPTSLDTELLGAPPGMTGHRYDRLAESHFLETYRGIHCAVLGLDANAERYLFGAPNASCKEALLGLIDGEPKSIADFERERPEDISAMLAMLNNTSQLFERSGKQWKCVWSKEMLGLQATRAMQQHFDQVVELSFAWRGRQRTANGHDGNSTPPRRPIGDDYGTEKFSLPWQEDDVWVSEFLECSRILARGRYADEAAQLLIYRLSQFLDSRGKSLSDVHVLASITAPALLLASAMHRWWPIDKAINRPSIADLGHYMLRPDSSPLITTENEGIVIVQDVLSAGVMSGRLIKRLQKHGGKLLGLISLVQLTDVQQTQATRILDWQERYGVPHHSMIHMLRPPTCSPPALSEPDSRHYWVEPRTLRPFQYSMLRGDRSIPSALEALSAVGAGTFEKKDTCLLRAGHYVYGSRHYSLVINVQRVLQGDIGDRLAAWVADVCEGPKDRVRTEWESQAGHALKGDISAVVMPVNSQIHYLWPKVEDILAQRGRRQPMWMLDATLFLGRQPEYRLPLQFKKLLFDTVADLNSRETDKSGARKQPLRILVLDDGIATGRTALTILDAIQRAIRQGFRWYDIKLSGSKLPVQWMRYFAVFNQMSYSLDQHWHSMESIGGGLSVPFVFEEYLRCIGFPQPDEDSCPQCVELSNVRDIKEQHRRIAGDDDAFRWLNSREEELKPVLIEDKRFQQIAPVRLDSRIEVLPPRRSTQDDTKVYYRAQYADTAIGIFYELMYRSYPIEDVFRHIARTFPGTAKQAERTELERYRWAVIEWGIRNWQRVVASGGRRSFFDCAKLELQHNTSLVEPLFYALARLHSDERYESESSSEAADGQNGGRSSLLCAFIREAINTMVELDNSRASDDQPANRVDCLIRLNTALNVFFMRLQAEQVESPDPETANALANRLLKHLEHSVGEVDEHTLGFVRQLYMRFRRPGHSIPPAWPLYVIAESLFRFRPLRHV